MEEVRVKLRRWGNSLGVVLPQEILKEVNKNEGDEVTLFLKKEDNDLTSLFGRLKNWKIDSQNFKDEIRKEECRKK